MSPDPPSIINHYHGIPKIGDGTKPGLWTLDWTMDWIMDSISD